MFSPLFIVWLLTVDYFNKLLTVQSVSFMSVFVLQRIFRLRRPKVRGSRFMLGSFNKIHHNMIQYTFSP